MMQRGAALNCAHVRGAKSVNQSRRGAEVGADQVGLHRHRRRGGCAAEADAAWSSDVHDLGPAQVLQKLLAQGCEESEETY